MPSSHLILCHPLFLLPPIPPSIRVFSNESTLCMRWPRYWNFSFAAAKSLQSCPTLCDPIDGSPLGSPVPGILHARTLEWVAISFSNAWKWKVKVKLLSRVWPSATPWTAAFQAPPSRGFPGKSTGVGCHRLLQQCWLCPPYCTIILPWACLTPNSCARQWSPVTCSLHLWVYSGLFYSLAWCIFSLHIHVI